MSAVLGASRWEASSTGALPADPEPLDPAAVAPKPGGLHVTDVHAEHADRVWRTLQRLGVRDADLEDQLQEVFVVVHRHLASFDGRVALSSWLFGISKRVAASYRRRAHVRRERPTEPMPETTDSAAGPEDALAAHQAREALDAVLDDLDLDKRAVFVMFELDEMSCEQIAGELGIPLGTVYSRLSSARKAFQKAVTRTRARNQSNAGGSR
jgi:RNA polymerase sigma-70 factor, ECF subfamily